MVTTSGQRLAASTAVDSDVVVTSFDDDDVFIATLIPQPSGRLRRRRGLGRHRLDLNRVAVVLERRGRRRRRGRCRRLSQVEGSEVQDVGEGAQAKGVAASNPGLRRQKNFQLLSISS